MIALALRRPPGWRAPVLLAFAGVLVLFVTVLGVYAVPEYAVPVVPAFVLLAGVGLLGARTAAQRVRSDVRDTAPLRHGHPAGG
jgi:Na+/melibiose symporter-like transporter